MAKGCKICHAITLELDSTGRCLSCALAKAATDSGITYGKFVAAGFKPQPVEPVEEIVFPEPEPQEAPKPETKKGHPCAWCGTMIFDNRRTYCCDQCQRDHNKVYTRDKARKRKGQIGPRYCAICGAELPEELHWAKKACPGKCSWLYREIQARKKSAAYQARKKAKDG